MKFKRDGIYTRCRWDAVYSQKHLDSAIFRKRKIQHRFTSIRVHITGDTFLEIALSRLITIPVDEVDCQLVPGLLQERLTANIQEFSDILPTVCLQLVSIRKWAYSNVPKNIPRSSFPRPDANHAQVCPHNGGSSLNKSS